jgi:hypothetical protein
MEIARTHPVRSSRERRWSHIGAAVSGLADFADSIHNALDVATLQARAEEREEEAPHGGHAS